MQLAINTLLGGGLSEELGWRGFMTPHLSKRRTPLAASLIVAVAWFAWHIPGYLLTNKAEADPILPFAVIVFPLSVVLTWLYYRASESLLLPVLLHASLNASSYAMLILIPQVASAPTFQPANDWVLAGIWVSLAVVVLARAGAELGRTAASNRTDA
jgi:membrane protease YdiL (CAAX protease family)